MKKSDENPRQRRITVVYGFVVIACLSLISRLSYVQMVRGKSFRAFASTSRFTHLPTLPKRGWIYDANMNILAFDRPSYSILLTRLCSKKQQYPELAKCLSPILGVPEKDLLWRMTEKSPGDTRVKIFESATQAQISYIAEHQSELPGVQYVEDTLRVYPQGPLAGHIVGYIQPQPADMANYYVHTLHYLPDQKVGISGVEKSYDNVLQGKVGYDVWTVNNEGVPLKNFGMDPEPVSGHSVQLTIDGRLQAKAQELVTEAVDHVRDHEWGKEQKTKMEPTDAEAVMLDVRTGGVLAMVSYPYYDPNWFTMAKQYEFHEKYINNPILTPIINHDLSSPRYPGSTVKPVNIIAGLESGIITASTTVADTGMLMVGTYPAHDWKKTGHGLVTPITAIQESCDTFMYQLGMWLAEWHDGPPAGKSVARWHDTDRVKGLNTLFNWEWKFGLGPKTGIDLPGESTGRFYVNDSSKRTIVRYDLQTSQEQMARSGQYHDNGLLYDNAFAAIGQMQEFTPIQLTEYAMMIANGGIKYRPHVVANLLDYDGKRMIQGERPVISETVKVKPATLATVRKGMFAAANIYHGTAYGSFFSAPYHAAGKTGTAEIVQQGKRTDISLFMGYAPYEHPQVAIAVMVPGGGESSDVAVPLARQLLDMYFQMHHEFGLKDKVTPTQGTKIPASWWRSEAVRNTESHR